MNTYTQTQNSGAEGRREQITEQLASFCRGEMSAAESYAKAMSHESLASYRDTFRRVQQSHESRVLLLTEKIRVLGGTVPTSSGAWGTLVTALAETASALSAEAAIAVLEEGEDHGLRDYRADVKNLDDETQAFMRQRIVPEQIDTHRTISALKHTLAQH
ncbi:MAG: DUF2383 domain-containing protein [Sandaracinaceae bacterium]|nr:DUF2383 domain-containing protein [Sandaracinaceae bacterium]